MKNKKNIVFAVIGIAIVIGIMIMISSFLPSYVNISVSDAGMINFTAYDNNISNVITESDTEKIKNLFQGKWCYLDDPSCGFSENVSIKIGNDIFMPACDGCPIVKYKKKYLLLSDDERAQLDAILSNYGVSFPCV